MRGWQVMGGGALLWLASLGVARAGQSGWPDDVGARLRALAGGRPAVAAMVIEDGRIVGASMQRRLTVDPGLAVALAALGAIDRGQLSDDAALVRQLHATLVGHDRTQMAALAARLGGAQAIQRTLEDLGIDGFAISGHQRLRARATPLAMLTLLDRIEQGAALSASSRARLLRLLRHPASPSQRPAPRPAASAWWLLARRGDTGLGVVTLPDGRHLALVVHADRRTASVGAMARWLWREQVAPAARLALADAQ